MSTKIKICGITSLEDALAALDAGADFLGLIFAQSSPRRVEESVAKEIVAAASGRAQIVGVFKDQEIEYVSELAMSLKLDYVQCHGKETVEYARRLPTRVIKVIELQGMDESPQELNVHGVESAAATSAVNSTFNTVANAAANVAEAPVDVSAESSAAVTEPSIVPNPPELSILAAEALAWKDDAAFLLFDRPKLLKDPEWYKRAINELKTAEPLAMPYFFAGGLTASNVGEVVATLQPFAVDVASSVEAAPGQKDIGKMKDFCKAVKRDSGGVSACAH